MIPGESSTPPIAAAITKLLDHVREPAGPVAALESAHRVARAFERPVGIHLAEDVILVRPHEGRREPGNDDRLACRAGVTLGAERGVPEVGDDASRRQRLAAGGDLQRPFECGPHRRRDGRNGTLQPQSLQQEPLGLVRVAEDDHIHVPRCPFKASSFLIAPAYPAYRDSRYDRCDR